MLKRKEVTYLEVVEEGETQLKSQNSGLLCFPHRQYFLWHKDHF